MTDHIPQIAAALQRPSNDPLVAQIAALIRAVESGALSATGAQARLASDPALSPARSLVSFGDASIGGGIGIRDVAGGNIVTINIQSQASPPIGINAVRAQPGMHTVQHFPEVWDCDMGIVIDCLGHLVEDIGGLYGFTVQSDVASFQENFCERLVVEKGGRRKMRRVPTHFTVKNTDTTGAIQQCAHAVAHQKETLRDRHLLCSVCLESEDTIKLADQTTQLWEILKEQLNGIYAYQFVVVVFAARDYQIPHDLISLGPPRLHKGHIHDWIWRCTKMLNWDEATFRKWKETIIRSCWPNNVRDIQSVYEFLGYSRTILTKLDPLTPELFLEELISYQ